jgi:hypothetical protein
MKKREREKTIIDYIDGMTPVDAMKVLNKHPTEKDSLLTLWKRFIEEDDMPDDIRNMSDGQQLRRMLTLLHANLIGIKQYKTKGGYEVIVEFKNPDKWNCTEEEKEKYLSHFIEL